MKKAYYLLFYKLYSFFKTVSDDNWSDWKALVIVGGVNTFIILTIDIFIKILFNVSFILDLPNFGFVILFGFIGVSHFYIFLSNNNWKIYEEEFKQYSKIKNRTIDWLVLLFLIGVIISLIFAFYQMSLID